MGAVWREVGVNTVDNSAVASLFGRLWRRFGGGWPFWRRLGTFGGGWSLLKMQV